MIFARGKPTSIKLANAKRWKENIKRQPREPRKRAERFLLVRNIIPTGDTLISVSFRTPTTTKQPLIFSLVYGPFVYPVYFGPGMYYGGDVYYASGGGSCAAGTCGGAAPGACGGDIGAGETVLSVSDSLYFFGNFNLIFWDIINA